MVSRMQHSYTDDQIMVWLRGLLSVSWADGHFAPEEQALITTLMEEELAFSIDSGSVDPISPSELAVVLGQDSQIAENFLRTAVMVAIADGTYSPSEDELLHQFCTALGQQPEVLEPLRLTLSDRQSAATSPPERLLSPVRGWLDCLEVQDPRLARFLCRMIPSQCPFERDVALFGRKIVHIPPMCKINPLYEQLVALRFRALSYLADDCQEDVAKYC